MNVLRNAHLEVLITLGAGDIDKFVAPIARLLTAGEQP